MDVASWFITSFYRFTPLHPDGLVSLQQRFKEWMTGQGMFGLVLIAPEGVNGTVCGNSDVVVRFKAKLLELLDVGEIRFKDSQSGLRPFKRLSVDLREEIVGLKRPDLVPDSPENHHLSAAEWHEMMESSEPKLIIDTRNRYETALGKFKGAVDPGLQTFSEWSDFVLRGEVPRDVPVMLYCTGGIRCEKAILEMRLQGFEKVYQLRDGILGYLSEFPDGHFEGECFVFDERVSLGSDLAPSGNYGICPGCGLTSGEKRRCEWCGADYFVCAACEGEWKPVCSKTCLDRWKRHGKSCPR